MSQILETLNDKSYKLSQAAAQTKIWWMNYVLFLINFFWILNKYKIFNCFHLIKFLQIYVKEIIVVRDRVHLWGQKFKLPKKFVYGY